METLWVCVGVGVHVCVWCHIKLGVHGGLEPTASVFKDKITLIFSVSLGFSHSLFSFQCTSCILIFFFCMSFFPFSLSNMLHVSLLQLFLINPCSSIIRSERTFCWKIACADLLLMHPCKLKMWEDTQTLNHTSSAWSTIGSLMTEAARMHYLH